MKKLMSKSNKFPLLKQFFFGNDLKYNNCKSCQNHIKIMRTMQPKNVKKEYRKRVLATS